MVIGHSLKETGLVKGNSVIRHAVFSADRSQILRVIVS
jgi:hypothetical protein